MNDVPVVFDASDNKRLAILARALNSLSLATIGFDHPYVATSSNSHQIKPNRTTSCQPILVKFVEVS